MIIVLSEINIQYNHKQLKQYTEEKSIQCTECNYLLIQISIGIDSQRGTLKKSYSSVVNVIILLIEISSQRLLNVTIALSEISNQYNYRQPK